MVCVLSPALAKVRSQSFTSCSFSGWTIGNLNFNLYDKMLENKLDIEETEKAMNKHHEDWRLDNRLYRERMLQKYNNQLEAEGRRYAPPTCSESV